METQEKIIRSAGRVGTGVFISRLTGFVRELCIAALFGTGMAGDVFVAAFRIPNLFRRLLGEGSLNAAFIPKYTEVLREKGEEKATDFATAVAFLLLICSLIIATLGIIFAPQMVSLLFFGWRDNPEKLRLAIRMTRLLLPYVILVITYSFTSGFLNIYGVFFLPAAASAGMNILGIVGLLIGYFFLRGWRVDALLFFVASFFLAGGIVQMLITLLPSIKRGLRISPLIRENKAELKALFHLLLPGIFSFAIVEINHLVDLFLASTLREGSVSSLRYANLLVLLPLSLIATSLYTALLPSSSRIASTEPEVKVAHLAGFGIKLIFALLIPLSVFMITFNKPLVELLFQRGFFSKEVSVPMTALALTCYAYGLFAYGGIKMITQAFYSFQDTFTPFKVACYAAGVNIILNLILMRYLYHGGLALATSIAAFINFVALIVILRVRIRGFNVKPLIITFVRSLFLSIIIFGGLYLITSTFWTALVRTKLTLLFTLSLIALLGAVLYIVLAPFVRLREVEGLLKFLKILRNRVSK